MKVIATFRSISLILKLLWIEISAKAFGSGADSKTYIDWALKSRSKRNRNILLRQAIRLAEHQASAELVLMAFNKIDFENLPLKDYALVRMHRTIIEAAAWVGTDFEYNLAKQVVLERVDRNLHDQIFLPQLRELMTWRECGAGAIDINVLSRPDYSMTYFRHIYYWLMFEATRTQGQENQSHRWLELAAGTTPEGDPRRSAIISAWRLENNIK